MAERRRPPTTSRQDTLSTREPRRYGLGWILVTIALSTALFAALGVLVAHFGH